MARTKLISAPRATGNSAQGSWRQLSGSMGALAPEHLTETENQSAEKFEAAVVPDADWERTVAQREAQEGIQHLAQTQHPPYPKEMNIEMGIAGRPETHYTQRVVVEDKPKEDLSSLPDKFTLLIERKPDGWWKITAPDSHVGLYVAYPDLNIALQDAPGALAQILRLDGVVPAAKRGRKTR